MFSYGVGGGRRVVQGLVCVEDDSGNVAAIYLVKQFLFCMKSEIIFTDLFCSVYSLPANKSSRIFLDRLDHNILKTIKGIRLFKSLK